MKLFATLVLILGFVFPAFADEIKDPKEAVKALQKYLPHKVKTDGKFKYVGDIKDLKDTGNIFGIELVTDDVTWFEFTDKLSGDTVKIVPAALDTKPCPLVLDKKDDTVTIKIADEKKEENKTWKGSLTLKIRDGKILSLKATQRNGETGNPTKDLNWEIDVNAD